MFVGGVELYFALAFVGCVKLRFNFGAAMFRLVERQAQRTERGGENRNAENHAYRQVCRPEMSSNGTICASAMQRMAAMASALAAPEMPAMSRK